MGERIVRNDEVVGSIPTSSTKSSLAHAVLKDVMGLHTKDANVWGTL